VIASVGWVVWVADCFVREAKPLSERDTVFPAERAYWAKP